MIRTPGRRLKSQAQQADNARGSPFGGEAVERALPGRGGSGDVVMPVGGAATWLPPAPQGQGSTGSFLQDLSSTLGLSASQIQQQLAAGSSLSQIATNQGVSQGDLLSAVEGVLSSGPGQDLPSNQLSSLANHIVNQTGLPERQGGHPPPPRRRREFGTRPAPPGSVVDPRAQRIPDPAAAGCRLQPEPDCNEPGSVPGRPVVDCRGRPFERTGSRSPFKPVEQPGEQHRERDPIADEPWCTGCQCRLGIVDATAFDRLHLDDGRNDLAI